MARQPLDDKGISEIIGALLLILIVVIAAAGLAMIVSQAEQQQANRQALQDAITNEKLGITSIQLVNPSPPNVLFPIAGFNVTIQNLNVEDSNIVYITVNGIPYNMSANVLINGKNDNLNNSGNRITVPASGIIHISLNNSSFLSPGISNFYNNQSIVMQIGTAYGNFYSKTITPPTSVITVNIGSENVGVTQRDYIILDGSGSTAEGQILNWFWTITDGSRTWGPNSTGNWTPQPGNWNDPIQGNFTIVPMSGKVIRYEPVSDGPFNVTLYVIDNNSMVSQTVWTVIPQDTNFDPATTLRAYINGTNVTATVTDAYNNPLQNVMVYFTVLVDKAGNMLFSPISGLTGSNGTITSTIVNGSGSSPIIINGSGSSSIQVSSGTLTPVVIPINATY
jgi:flagellin-like protein